MGIDLANLTPAPWASVWQGIDIKDTCVVAHKLTVLAKVHSWSGAETEANANFIAVARNALDVMMRRGWTLEKPNEHGWLVITDQGHPPEHGSPEGRMYRPDPFTALVDADRWYKEVVEAKR